MEYPIRTPFDNAMDNLDGAWAEYEKAPNRDSLLGVVRAWRFAVWHMEMWLGGHRF